MRRPVSFLSTWLGLSLVLVAGCQRQEGDLQQHAAACEQLCGDAQSQCATDPAFADPWALSCEVACNLEFEDPAAPVQTCVDAAGSCAEIDACLGPGPSLGGTGPGGDDGATATTSTTGASTTPDDGGETTDGVADDGLDTAGDSTGSGFEGPACCDVSGAPCTDAEVSECTCAHMPGCCGSGIWGEVCASVAVANGCIDEGCPAFEGWPEYSCTCNTIDVWCPDDPFVSQIIFGTDACGSTEAEALAIANAACEQGDGVCEIGAGSCDCTCSSFGDTCGPTGG